MVKYGGHAMGDPALAKAFARDITLLETSGVRPVVVHGGGPQIGEMLKRLGIKSEFRGGLRVTDKQTIDVVEMVLAGSINKEIVMAINAEGGKAVGLSGKDGNMVFAEKVTRTEIDPDSNIEKVSRPRLRRRAEDGQPRRDRHGARRRADPGDRAGRARRGRRRPTTSTPTPSPAPSPARSARRASSSSPTCPASSTRTGKLIKELTVARGAAR